MQRHATLLCIAILGAACGSDNEAPQESRALTYEFLMNGEGPGQAVRLSEFVPSNEALPATNRFSGRLSASMDPVRSRFTLLKDELSIGEADGADTLPELELQLVQVDDRIEVLGSPFQHNEHPWWQFVVLAGRAWDEPKDNGFTRAVLPFALKERNADCIHNGLVSFLFREDGAVSNLAFQVSHQTCKYLQFEWHGLLDADYAPAKLTLPEMPVSPRMPQRPIDELAKDYPGASPAGFGSSEEIAPETMTTRGFVIDGIHYTGACSTPLGEYPYCDSMALPSYSTAKSFVAGLAVMRAQKLYPGVAEEFIADLVPECQEGWGGITIGHALDMATGRYQSPQPHVDENSGIVNEFFLSETHAIKVERSCNQYPHKEAPGQRWVYHSSDTYLVGVALNRFIRDFRGPDTDFFQYLLVDELWPRLGFSALMSYTRRTYDDYAQPFTGWGITMVRDDVAKLLQFVGELDGKLDNEDVFDRQMFDAARTRQTDDPGLRADTDRIHYNNGFRTYDVTEELNCESPTYVATMSGYGGINFVIMPNDTGYYYFSDGGTHRYLSAVRESHRIRPMCQ